MPIVAWITIAPVKSLGLVDLEQAELTAGGIRGDRAFHLVDADGRLANGKRFGSLVRVAPSYDPDARTLTLSLPDGAAVTGLAEPADPVVTVFYGEPRPGRLVPGPWDDALSEIAGHAVRLAVTDDRTSLDRPGDGAVSLLGTGSLARLAAELGLDGPLDPRRFRMTIGIEGIAAHAEDTWLGSAVRVGRAVVVPRGNVGRCAVTRQNPETGDPDVDTLGGLTRYRGVLETTEPLPFGVHAEVVEPGRIAVGDPVLVG